MNSKPYRQKKKVVKMSSTDIEEYEYRFTLNGGSIYPHTQNSSSGDEYNHGINLYGSYELNKNYDNGNLSGEIRVYNYTDYLDGNNYIETKTTSTKVNLLEYSFTSSYFYMDSYIVNTGEYFISYPTHNINDVLYALNHPFKYHEYTSYYENSIFSDETYYDYLMNLQQIQSSYNEITSEVKVLYSYNPRTARLSFNTENINISIYDIFLCLQNYPFIIKSSYVHLANTIWPNVEYSFSLPNFDNANNVNTYVLAEDGPGYYSVNASIAYNLNSNDKYFISKFTLDQENQQIWPYFQYYNNITIENNYLIDYQIPNNLFLQSNYNPDGIITSSTNDLFRKLIVLPECNNINKIIKSEISITPVNRLTSGKEIKIALPSFNSNNPDNNINLHTNDNIFNLTRLDNNVNLSIKSINYEESIQFNSNKVTNLFNLLFPATYTIGPYDAYFNVYIMEINYDSPSYQTHTLTRNVQAGETYTFEIESPVFISNRGIVYHLQVPSQCNFTIKPYFIDPISYPEVILPSNVSSVTINPVIMDGYSFTISSSNIPSYLAIDSAGIITGQNITQSGACVINVNAVENDKTYQTNVYIKFVNNDNIVKYNTSYDNIYNNDISITCNKTLSDGIFTGNLPEGLFINSDTGEIYGNLNKGIYNISVNYIYQSENNTYNYSMNINLLIIIPSPKFNVFLQDNIFLYSV